MNSPYAFALIAASAAVVLVIGFGRWLGPLGWMDVPSDRKQHAHPLPRVGGLVLLVLLGIFKLAGWLDLSLSTLEWSVVIGVGAMGVLDDRFDLRARWKALLGLLLAIPLAVAHTLHLLQGGITVVLFGLNLPSHAAVFFPLLLMWYWAVPHAFNLIDGLNGLLLGFGCLVLAALSLGPGAQLASGAAPLWGILVALLLMNFPKAMHFMGDSGSLAMGSLFAILVMHRALPVQQGLALWILAYPVLDVTTVVAIRWINGHPLGYADRSHFHYWLLDRFGGRAWLAVPVLLAVAALPMTRVLDWPKPLSLIGLLILFALAITVFIDRVFGKSATQNDPNQSSQYSSAKANPLNEPTSRI